MNVLIRHLSLQWRKRLSDPSNRPSLPEGKATYFTACLLQRKPQHGALLGFGINNDPGELGHHSVQPLCRTRRRRLRQQRHACRFRVGGRQ